MQAIRNFFDFALSYYLNNSSYTTAVSALATYRPPQVTTIYADDGETVLAEFAIEKRIPVKIQDVPDRVTDALLAIEDYRFRDHIGIDLCGVEPGLGLLDGTGIPDRLGLG